MRLRAYIQTPTDKVMVWYSFQYAKWLLTPTRDTFRTLSVEEIADAIDVARKYNLPLQGITVIDSKLAPC